MIQHLDMAADVERALWADACLAAEVFALFMREADYKHAGLCVKAHAGPVRDAWMAQLKSLLPEHIALHQVPSTISMERLLGGLDLGRTLAHGKAVEMRGVLAEADQNILFLPSAGLAEAQVISALAAALDSQSVQAERDGVSTVHKARFGVLCFDESDAAEDAISPVLSDRMMLHIDLRAISVRAAQRRLCTVKLRHDVALPGEILAKLCQLPPAFGLTSMRPAMQMIMLAKTLCALAGDDTVDDSHVSAAIRLGLIHRALAVPPPPSQDDEQDTPSPPEPDEPDAQEPKQHNASEVPDDMVLESAHAAIPSGLLATLQAAAQARKQRSSLGRRGARQKGGKRGRPLTSRKGDLTAGKRLDLVATLRAAAPFQKARARQAQSRAPEKKHRSKVHVRASDFHIRRIEERSETSTIFVVDASGSTALNRLREAKGAVELLLGESYARRDYVSLIGFRGREAQVLLPPTRALVRAKRSLAALPGGGGTPLASGIEAAIRLAEDERGRGRDAAIVLMTDGSANVDLMGAGGRSRAAEDAQKCARMVAYLGIPSILVDIARQPQDKARQLAQTMHATYLPMPFAGAQELSLAVGASR
ncbi:MAG: magnesium chelatase subunit D [Pseudomonadota bacterium]